MSRTARSVTNAMANVTQMTSITRTTCEIDSAMPITGPIAPVMQATIQSSECHFAARERLAKVHHVNAGPDRVIYSGAAVFADVAKVLEAPGHEIPPRGRRKDQASQYGKNHGSRVAENLSRSDQRNCQDSLENENKEQEVHATADG